MVSDAKENIKKYRVCGYVKLAKLWERKREEAIKLHTEFFNSVIDGFENAKLVGIYIDITGAKHIYKRKEMVRLLRDVTSGRVDIILMQTRAYLAANYDEFCYIIYYLFNRNSRIDIITDDDDIYKIDTLSNLDGQREALLKMAQDYVAIKRGSYTYWKDELIKAINDIEEDGVNVRL